jgi:hypothetical protein
VRPSAASLTFGRIGAGGVAIAGLVQVAAADGAARALAMGLQGCPALGRVQGGGAVEGDERSDARVGEVPFRAASRKSRRGQAKATGGCQVLSHGPPYCCWTGCQSGLDRG